MKFFSDSLLLAGLFLSLTSASPIPEDDNSAAANPCLATPLSVSVQEIRGAHTHTLVGNSPSRRACCEACYKKKGCALYTYVAENDFTGEPYCRLTWVWDPAVGGTTEASKNTCPAAAKITTAYELAESGQNAYNFGPGPCGKAVNCQGACVASEPSG